MSSQINDGVFFVEDLRKCKTKDEVEKYFDSVSVDTIDKKMTALTKATGSSRVDYFDSSVDIEKKYNALLTVFLDEEFRFLKGY